MEEKLKTLEVTSRPNNQCNVKNTFYSLTPANTRNGPNALPEEAESFPSGKSCQAPSQRVTVSLPFRCWGAGKLLSSSYPARDTVTLSYRELREGAITVRSLKSCTQRDVTYFLISCSKYWEAVELLWTCSCKRQRTMWHNHRQRWFGRYSSTFNTLVTVSRNCHII